MAWRLAIASLLAIGISAEATAGENGLFVAVGYGGRRITSRDGLSWENDQCWNDEAKDNDDVLFNVAFGAGRFIAVGGGAKTGHILSTRDGREWTSLQDVKGRVATVVFGNGRFVAAHDPELLYSTDGEKFEAGQRLDWKGSIHARCSACGDTEAGFGFVIIGDVDLWVEKKRVSWRGMTSDGTHWDHTALDAPAARDIAYGAGHFVVVGPNGLIEASHDGQTWQRFGSDPNENFSHIVWTGKRFLVTGGKSPWSSPDGFTWTRETGTIPCSVAWAREGWLGIGFSWGGNIFSSRDFVDWKKATIPPGPSLNAVAFGEP
jgi:hypothetical protein